ncbi:MAG: discoidin domain-containing protein [Clostridia bacterium]|nr:discoidin domain-containing protein [Clostridia bacterium]
MKIALILMLAVSLSVLVTTAYAADGNVTYTKLEITEDMITSSVPWNDGDDVAANAFDGNTSTFFDGVEEGWIEIDLGAEYLIGKIGYAPRSLYESRLTGTFYGSADGVTWYKIYTVSPVYEMTTVDYTEFATVAYFRYIKYENTEECANISEIELYSAENIDDSYLTDLEANASFATVDVVYTKLEIAESMITSSVPWNNGSDVAANAFDGSTSTFFDGLQDGWIEIDLGAEYLIGKIAYAPRSIYEYRLTGTFYGSLDGETWYEIYTVQPVYEMTEVNYTEFEIVAYFRYIKYENTEECANISEIELYSAENIPEAYLAVKNDDGTYAASSMSSANSELIGSFPMAVVVDTGAGYSYDIYAVETNGSYWFYVPASVDLSAVTIKYVGNGTMADASGGGTLSANETDVFDASSGSAAFTVYSSLTSSSSTYKANFMSCGEIKAVYITLDGGDDDFEYVQSSKGNSAEGDIIIAEADGELVYSGGLSKMAGHGLTSFSPGVSNKNSYNIKLESKSELISGSGSSKKWVLLSPRLSDWSRDNTGLCHLSAYYTYNALIGLPRATIRGEYVDLYVDGEYRGLYILTERMNNNAAFEVEDLEDYVEGGGSSYKVMDKNDVRGSKDSAIQAGIRQYTYCDDASLVDSDVDITGGYVLEVMCGTYDGCGFITEHGVYFTIKSPEYCTRSMVKYIAEYVQNFENALFSETGYNSEGVYYMDYIDAESYADLILVNAFYENFEFFRTSTYIYKDADGNLSDVLTFGPVWDFETTYDSLMNDDTFFGTANNFTYNVEQQYVWAEQLWQKGDFMAVLYSENERMTEILSQYIGLSDAKSITPIEDIVASAKQSGAASSQRWGVTDYSENAELFVEAVKERYETWTGELWNASDYLFGVTTGGEVNDDGSITLTASVLGSADGSLKWYRLDGTSLTYVTDGDSITVEEDGSVYYAVVSGGNNAYYRRASGDIFSEETVTMTSAPMTASASAYSTDDTSGDTDNTGVTEDIDGTSDGTDTGDDNSEKSGCGSVISTPALIIIAVLTTALTIKTKKERE